MRVAPQVTITGEERKQKNPRPFIRTVKADEIIRKVARLRELQATGK